MSKLQQVTVENVNVPGQTKNVDANKYRAVKEAMLQVSPDRSPGLTHAELCTDMKPYLEDLFPGGAKVEWWSKTALSLACSSLPTLDCSLSLANFQ